MTNRELTSTDIMVRNAWYVAGLSSEFETEALQQRIITERAVVLWRTKEGQMVAFDDRCCHKRMPLSAGRILENGAVECPYHGLCFDTQGQCIRIPSAPDAPIPKRAKLQKFPLIERDGLVWLWPGDPQKIDEIAPPPTPEIIDDRWERITGSMTIKANSVLMIENGMDITHFYPLHAKTIGQPMDSAAPMECEMGELNGVEFVKSSRTIDGYKQSADFADLLGYEFADSYSSQMMIGPGMLIAERILWPAGQRREDTGANRLKNFHMFTPINKQSHVYRYIVNMPAGQKSGKDSSKRSVDRAKELLATVFAEDVWALERQQEMFELPDEGYREVLLKSDIALARGREILLRMQRKEMLTEAEGGSA